MKKVRSRRPNVIMRAAQTKTEVQNPESGVSTRRNRMKLESVVEASRNMARRATLSHEWLESVRIDNALTKSLWGSQG